MKRKKTGQFGAALAYDIVTKAPTLALTILLGGGVIAAKLLGFLVSLI